MATIPTILRGEDTAARGRSLAINLPEGDYTGLTIRLQWCGLERSWESPASGASLRFDFSAADTLPIPLGTHMGRLGVVLPDGTGYIISEDIRIRVTDDVAEATGEANTIYISPVDAAAALDLDLDGIEDEPATPDALRAAWKELLARLRAAVGVALVCVGLTSTARAEGRLVAQTARSGSLPYEAQVVTNVTLEGEIGIDAGTATNIAERIVEAATNALPRGIDGQTATNIVQDVVTKGYVEDLGIKAGTDGQAVTNIVEGIVADATNGVVKVDEYGIASVPGEIFVRDGIEVLNGGIQVSGSITSYGSIVANYQLSSQSVSTREILLDGSDVTTVFAARTNLPPLSATSTVGDLVDAYNGIVNALRKEEP